MKSRHVLIALLLASAAIYLLTAPRSIFLGDNAEFVTAAQVFGVPHPPGFPLLVLIGKLFSYLPIASIPLKINLVSVVFGVASLGFGYAILRRLSGLVAPDISQATRNWTSGALMLALALSDLFWMQSITAEAYALNTFFVVALLYLLLRWWKGGDWKVFILSALVLGLGLANHPMMLLLSPAFVFGFLAGPRLRWKTYSGAAAILILCLGIYALLPLISSGHPALDWGRTSESFENFYSHLTRAQYQDLGVSSSLADKGKFFASFLRDLGNQFGVFLLLLPFGMFFLFRSHPRFFASTVGVIFLNVLGIILLRSAVFDFEARYFYSVYYEPTYFIIFLYCASALFATADLLLKKSMSFKRFAGPTLLVISLMLVASMGLRNHGSHSLEDFRFIDDYTKAMLESMQSDAVLLTSFEGAGEDTWLFALLYQQAVAGIRPDVTVIGYVDIFKNSDTRDVNDIYRKETVGLQRDALVNYSEKNELKDRPVYTTFIVDPLPAGERYMSESNGYLYKLTAKGADRKTLRQNAPYELSSSDEAKLMADFSGRDVLAYYYIASATLLVDQGELKGSQALYIKAINADSDPTGMDISSYRPYRQAALEQL